MIPIRRHQSCVQQALAIVTLAAALGCASTPTSTPASPAAPSPTVTAPPSTAPATGADAAAELPEGRGKQILLGSCTSCHDLREVTKFRGYYTRAQWRDIVVTMVEYGAEVGKQDIEVLADYLDEHLGKRVTASKP